MYNFIVSGSKLAWRVFLFVVFIITFPLATALFLHWLGIFALPYQVYTQIFLKELMALFPAYILSRFFTDNGKRIGFIKFYAALAAFTLLSCAAIVNVANQQWSEGTNLTWNFWKFASKKYFWNQARIDLHEPQIERLMTGKITSATEMALVRSSIQLMRQEIEDKQQMWRDNFSSKATIEKFAENLDLTFKKNVLKQRLTAEENYAWLLQDEDFWLGIADEVIKELNLISANCKKLGIITPYDGFSDVINAVEEFADFITDVDFNFAIEVAADIEGGEFENNKVEDSKPKWVFYTKSDRERFETNITKIERALAIFDKLHLPAQDAFYRYILDDIYYVLDLRRCNYSMY